MNKTMKLATLMTASVFFSLTGCTKAPPPQAEKYKTVQDASKALNETSEEIDRLIVQLGKAPSDQAQKKLSCEQIPQQYDRMLAIIEANQYLMTEADKKVQADFKQLALQQKQRFQSNLLCK